MCNKIVKDHSIEKISYEERKNRRKDFDYSKLYEFFDVEDLMGNILPILRYFGYPLTLYHWFAKKEKTKDNTVLRKYLATMDLKDFSSYRFSDSSYLLNIELSNNSIYFDYLKRTQPLAI